MLARSNEEIWKLNKNTGSFSSYHISAEPLQRSILSFDLIELSYINFATQFCIVLDPSTTQRIQWPPVQIVMDSQVEMCI